MECVFSVVVANKLRLNIVDREKKHLIKIVHFLLAGADDGE